FYLARVRLRKSNGSARGIQAPAGEVTTNFLLFMLGSMVDTPSLARGRSTMDCTKHCFVVTPYGKRTVREAIFTVTLADKLARRAQAAAVPVNVPPFFPE